MQISKSSAQQSQEILGKILEGKNPDIQSFLINGCKSFRSIAETVRGLGLTYSPQQLEIFLSDLFEESKRFNSRQLEPDWAFIYVDAKVIDLVDDSGAIKKAVHFTALGVNLKNRGVTRVLMLITDDFAGLNKMASSLLPSCDHQLCLVHLMRNLKKNLSQKLYEEFGQLLQEIYLAASFEAASIKLNSFIENQIKPESSSYAKYLRTL